MNETVNPIENEAVVSSEEQTPIEQMQSIIAVVQGQSLSELPADLYIPPEALQVFLDAFEGPLDLLLYLIKRQNLDILDIPIAAITRQYIEYVELMTEMKFELAAEYLVMAAVLAEIKSRMLLPRQVEDEEEEDDPRAELVRRLQEYEQFKQAAEDLDNLPREGRDVHLAQAEKPDFTLAKPEPDVELKEILIALSKVLKRADVNVSHKVQFDSLSVHERMSQILTNIGDKHFVAFERLFEPKEGRLGVVVTFLAMLELVKQALIEIVQNEPNSPIHVKACAV